VADVVDGVEAGGHIHVQAEGVSLEEHVGIVAAWVAGLERLEARRVTGLEQVGQLVDHDGVEHPGRSHPQS